MAQPAEENVDMVDPNANNIDAMIDTNGSQRHSHTINREHSVESRLSTVYSPLPCRASLLPVLTVRVLCCVACCPLARSFAAAAGVRSGSRRLTALSDWSNLPAHVKAAMERKQQLWILEQATPDINEFCQCSDNRQQRAQ